MRPHAQQGRGRAGRLARLVAILVVLGAELVFVVGLYHLDDPVEDRRVAVARLEALLPDPGTGVASSDFALLYVAVRVLSAVDAPGASRVAALAPRAAAGDPTTADRLRDAVGETAAAVASQRAGADRTVLLGLVGLFVVVCAGWFTWFRGLARRHRAVQEALTASEMTARGERRVQALVHNSADLVVVLDGDSTATFVSPASVKVVGHRPEAIQGRRFLDLVEGEDQPLLAQALARSDGDEHALSLRVVHADGRRLVVEGSVNDLHEDPGVAGWVVTLRDVTERRRLEEDLTHQAFHDALTGLANRQLFTDRLDHALQRREAAGGDVAVLFVDIDDFKVVNDSLGHQAGDALLVAAARRMSSTLRPQDTVARLGGDEFAVLLEDTDLDDAAVAARRLLGCLEGAFEIEGRRHEVRASVGLAGAGEGAGTSRELMRNADVAMYHAKSQGKGRLALYDESLHQQAMDLLALRGELAEAIAGGQLVLHYQPTVALEGHTVQGFEALVRWQHPTRGLLMPAEFIPVAEESGLVVALGAWVLDEACRAGTVLDRDDEGLFVAVNVAAQQLAHPDFCAGVVEALRRSGLAPHRLVLEVTETVVLGDVEHSVAALAGLRELGVRVAIDDFGTGYNSLSTLASLPVDVLKVDRSFVNRLGGTEDASSLVEAILAMSDALHLETVAEGVELAHQADWLRHHRAALAQGYLWSRPVALEEARALLARGVGPQPEPVAAEPLLPEPTRPAELGELAAMVEPLHPTADVVTPRTVPSASTASPASTASTDPSASPLAG